MTVGVARVTESRAIDNFLDATGVVPSGLVLEGEAGIGKTTLWLSAIDNARTRGFRVLPGRPGPAEMALTYSGLADLMTDVGPADWAGLPQVQLDALDRVRANTALGAHADERLVGAALLSALEQLAQTEPVVVAIDDLQWLDTSSRTALAFAVRRLKGRVGILATIRSDFGQADAASWVELMRPDTVQRLRVTPFSFGALHALITTRLGRALPRPAITRIHKVSNGNPFCALELARMIADDPGAVRGQLPATLAAVVSARIGEITPNLREILLAAASTAVPTVEILVRACGSDVASVVTLLEEAETSGIVQFEGNKVTFTQPILSAGVYSATPPAQRRRIHRRLADIVEQPELKAMHLALSATSGDSAMLAAFDSAASTIRSKGAPAAAAELLDMAIRLGGDTPLRRIQSADNHFRAGDALRARAVLEPAIEALPPCVLRAMALNLLAGVCVYTEGFMEAAKYLERALPDAAANPALAVHTKLMLSFVQISAGEFDASLGNVKQAALEVVRLDDSALISQVLSMWVMVNCICGHGIDEAGIQRSLELEDPETNAPIVFRASANNAQLLAWRGRLGEARSQMLECRRRSEERGAEDELLFVAVQSVLIEIWSGNLGEATLLAGDAVQRAEQLGGDNSVLMAMTVQTAVASYTGREHDTREYGRQALAAGARCGSRRVAEWPAMMLGFLEVSLGRYSEALKILDPLVAGFPKTSEGTEIISATYIPDAVEAMVALGRVDDAEPMIAALELNGARLDRPWMLALGARCRAMAHAARGDIDAATSSAQDAIREHDRLPMPFERARTQLLLGQLLRRARHKEAAAASMDEAQRTFERLGTSLWTARASAERERTKVPWSRDLALTPSEQKVAELAAAGATNRDIAATLFISAKTVEANMTRIYRKLDIRSRAELGRRLDASHK